MPEQSVLAHQFKLVVAVSCRGFAVEHFPERE